jgi:light-harvesting complex II chlorophyll a/b binding protein 7
MTSSSFVVVVGGGAVLSAPWFSSSSSSSSSKSVRLSTRATTRERGRTRRRLNKIRLVADSKKKNNGEEEEKDFESKKDAWSSSSSSSSKAKDDDDTIGQQQQQFIIENVVSSPLFYVTFGVALGVVLVQKFGSNASLLFSALPVVLLTCVSKSDLGDGLREQARKAKEADEGGTEGGREGRERMRALAKAKFPMYFGKERGRWMPRKSVSFFSGGDSDDDASSSFMFPSYLDGTLAGDAQFDPLRLSDTEEKRRRNVELELLHGRWAMLAVVGVCVPEILSRSGALELSEPIWWKIGEKVLEGIDVNYLGIEGFHIAGASGIIGIAFCQAVLMGGPEYARYVGIESLEPVGVYLPGDTNYPGGGPFDPFNLSADAERDVELRVSEVKHGRLAMIAMLGVFAQAFVTREGPVANVLEFF